MERIIVDSLKCLDLSGIAAPMAVIYNHPADVPGKYVVRIWEAASGKPTNIEMRKDSLQECRDRILEAGIFHAGVPAGPKDDPVIVETWI